MARGFIGAAAGIGFALAASCASPPKSHPAFGLPCTELTPEQRILPVKRVNPMYPTRAFARGIGGHVEIEYSLTENGEPFDLDVIESVPEGVFDRYAVEAFRRWRFCPPPDGPDLEQKREVIRLSFTL